MNIIEQLMSYFGIDLNNAIDEALKDMENKLIRIKKLKNKRRNRKGTK